jgi:ribosomal protein S14
MVPCPTCGQPVDWVTSKAAAQLLRVSGVRVRQFIEQGRLPGTTKSDVGYRIPIDSVIALNEARNV